MRQVLLVITSLVAFFAGPSEARANCVVIDQLDKLQIIQARMARDPDSGLFVTDIRQIRAIMRVLSNRDALDAVDGNAIAGRGAQVVRFLTNTQALLATVSLDEPQSVRPHFTAAVRRNLDQVYGHLTDLRCTREQVNIARADAATRATRATSDEEDLADVINALGTLRQEVLRPRNLLGFALAAALAFLLVPVIRRWLVQRRRRAKRHPTNYVTRYRPDGGSDASGPSFEGKLLDINCFGTKLERAPDNTLDVGDLLDVGIEDGWINGQVIWSNQHYSGIRFKRSIDLGDVTEVIAKGHRP